MAARSTTPGKESLSGVPRVKETIIGAGALTDDEYIDREPQVASPLVKVTNAAGASHKEWELGGEGSIFPLAKVATSVGESCKVQETTLQSSSTVPQEWGMLTDSINNLSALIKEMGESRHQAATKRVYDSDDEEIPPSKCSKPGEISELFSESEEEPDILSTIEDDFQGDTGVGSPVKDKLATKINGRFKTLFNLESVRAKQKKYLRPSNCEKLSVPLCNEELWKKLSREQQLADIKSAQTQHSISHAVAAIIQVTESLLNGSKCKDTLNFPDLVEKLLDATLFLGFASNDISLRRRDRIVASLRKEFSGLKSKSVPITDHLFGDDLIKTLKDIKQACSLTSSNIYKQQSKNWRRPQQYQWKQWKQHAGGKNKGRGKNTKHTNPYQ
jgi:hypothetical protein